MKFWEEEEEEEDTNTNWKSKPISMKFDIFDDEGGQKRWKAETYNVSTLSIANYVESQTDLSNIEAKWVTECSGVLLSDGKKVGKFEANLKDLIPPTGYQPDGTIKL